MEFTICWREEYVTSKNLCGSDEADILSVLVTDMLVAVLNTCTKEELEESDEELIISPTSPSEDSAERRKVIKNKILAVGRMARVFALLRRVKFYPAFEDGCLHLS